MPIRLLRLTMEVFDKKAVKLLFQTRSYSNLSFLSCSTAQYPSPPPDLAIVKEKLMSLETVEFIVYVHVYFLRTCMSACLSAREFHYPVADTPTVDRKPDLSISLLDL